MAEKAVRTLENPPSEEEMSAAYDRIFGGGGESGEEPSSGHERTEQVSATETTETGEPEEEQAADRQGGKAEPEKAEDRGEFVTIEGKQYPVSEVREWQLGHMRQDHFTRETQRLAEERRAMTAQLTELTRANQQILEMYGRLKPDGTETQETEDQEPLPPGVDRALRNIQKGITDLQGRIEQREQADDDERTNSFIRQNFETTLTTLFDKFDIPKNEQALYKHAILGMDPAAADESGQVSAEAIRRETFRCFSELYRQRAQHQRQARREVTQELRQHARPPKKPEAKAAEEPEKPQPQKRKSREPWSTDEAATDFFERLAEVTAPPEG